MSERNERPEGAEDLPELSSPAPSFDPSDLPGAEVIFDDDDFRAVAFPVSALKGLGEDDLGSLAGALGGAGLGSGLPPGVAALLGLGGEPPEVQHMRTSFQQFKWATQELKAAKERHPETDPQKFDDEFAIVKPALEHTDLLAPEPVYRHHARELFDRLAAGEDTSKATEAEIFGLLMEGMQMTRFCNGLTALHVSLAQKITPEVYEKFLAEDPNETPETVAAFLAENKEDADNHRRELEEFLSHDRHGTEKTPLPVEPGEDPDDLLGALAALGEALGLPGLDEK
jgi:hypothetical protein